MYLQYFGDRVDDKAGTQSFNQKHHDALPIRTASLVSQDVDVNRSPQNAPRRLITPSTKGRSRYMSQLFRHAHDLLNAVYRTPNSSLPDGIHHLFIVVLASSSAAVFSLSLSSANYSRVNASLMALWLNKWLTEIIDTKRFRIQPQISEMSLSPHRV